MFLILLGILNEIHGKKNLEFSRNTFIKFEYPE